MALFSFVTEWIWIQVVFKRFPILSGDRDERPEVESFTAFSRGAKGPTRSWQTWWRREKEDCLEFSRLPIFASEYPPMQLCRFR